jgi:hypothetical protein
VFGREAVEQRVKDKLALMPDHTAFAARATEELKDAGMLHMIPSPKEKLEKDMKDHTAGEMMRILHTMLT